MSDPPKQAPSGLLSFRGQFWLVVLFEFFERGAYYGLSSVLSVYLVESVEKGGLGFSKGSTGLINSVVRPLLYLIPILSGAIADRFGYKRMLLLSFALLSAGYFLSGQVASYGLVFGCLLVMALGAGIFKPLISGTIARVTHEGNSGLGFGVYYWSINLGAFLFPLVAVNYLRQHGYPWSYIFTMSSIATGAMVVPALLLYREPPKPASTKTLAQVIGEAVLVLRDVRFIVMIVIYSGFWVLYFQQFDSVLWYLKDHVDMTPFDQAVQGGLSWLGLEPRFKFDSEHVTALNAGTIIALQLVVSAIVKNQRALPTMVVGIGIGTAGLGLLALSNSPWMLLSGMIVFSVGEMTAHPKYISYVGIIAPEDKKAVYMGYAFLYGVIGSSVGGFAGARLYEILVDRMHAPRSFWLVFVGVGIATMLGLVLYDRLLAPRTPASSVR